MTAKTDYVAIPNRQNKDEKNHKSSEELGTSHVSTSKSCELQPSIKKDESSIEFTTESQETNGLLSSSTFSQMDIESPLPPVVKRRNVISKLFRRKRQVEGPIKKYRWIIIPVCAVFMVAAISLTAVIISRKNEPTDQSRLNPIETTSQTSANELSAPEQFNYRVSYNALTLTWQPPQIIVGTIIKYEIFYTDNQSPTVEQWRKTSVSNVRTVTIRNLQFNTDYTFRIRARNMQGPGALSEPLLVNLGEEIQDKSEEQTTKKQVDNEIPSHPSDGRIDLDCTEKCTNYWTCRAENLFKKRDCKYPDGCICNCFSWQKC